MRPLTFEEVQSRLIANGRPPFAIGIMCTNCGDVVCLSPKDEKEPKFFFGKCSQCGKCFRQDMYALDTVDLLKVRAKENSDEAVQLMGLWTTLTGENAGSLTAEDLYYVVHEYGAELTYDVLHSVAQRANAGYLKDVTRPYLLAVAKHWGK